MKPVHKTTLIALSVSFILASAASAQDLKGVTNCGVLISTNCSGSTGMRACSLRRNIGTAATMTVTCAIAMSNNANCSIAMPGTSVQTFNAAQTGADPSCQWACSGCPDVTLDTVDGLPVELLEFDIEEGGSEEEKEDDKAGKPD